MEITFENSTEQAEIIKLINLSIPLLDVEYCKEAGNIMINRANQQESFCAVFTDYSPLKTQILKTKGKAMLMLCEYVDTLKEIDKLQKQLEEQEEAKKRSNYF